MSRAINKVVVALLTLMLMFIGINTASAHSTDADNSGCLDVTVTLDGETHVFTWADIEHAARLSNVDPLELKQAIEKGPDEEGRFSPFSYLSPLDNGLTREDLSELDKQKKSSTGVPLIKPLDEPADTVHSLRGYIARNNQDTTAYNWTGHKTANNNWPVLGIVACHRIRDVYGGNNYAPLIPFGTNIYLDRYVWLPDGVGYINHFYVDDTGLGPNKTNYWLDIYYHHDTASAQSYGNIVLNYNQEV